MGFSVIDLGMFLEYSCLETSTRNVWPPRLLKKQVMHSEIINEYFISVHLIIIARTNDMRVWTVKR